MISETGHSSEHNTGLFLQNNAAYLRRLRRSLYCRLFFFSRPHIHKLYTEYRQETVPGKKNLACAEILNAYEDRYFWKAKAWFRCFAEDIRVFFRQAGQRQTVDCSGKKTRDYYSIAVIVKNEARYIREFILFYQATGADRIYIYDNDSTDDLTEQIEPFVKSGFAVYRRWPGSTVQTAAYRDAVRRTRRRTRWLALVDADEFLFSPKGKMPDQLRNYESFAVIGVNWLVFGPNGHRDRPPGLVMKNYNERIADDYSMMNCHIKSVVQPGIVLCINHTHYAIYKGKGHAVDENREAVSNTFSFYEKTGRAFTGINHRDVFRINHYITRSYEDLEEKCIRGYPDGSPNAVFADQLKLFETTLVQDDTIGNYADKVSESALL